MEISQGTPGNRDGKCEGTGVFLKKPGALWGRKHHATDSGGQIRSGIEWYRELFIHCQDAVERGEASTLYFVDPESPKLIKRHLPDVKLIFILRDPVDRLYSHYWQSRKSGWEIPGSFEKAVRQRHPLHQKHCRVSSYKENLERFYHHFDPAQIRIVIFEQLKEHPVEVVRETYSFLNVDTSVQPKEIGK